MIAYLEGTVREIGIDWLVVQTGGVGYRVLTVGCSADVGDQVTFDIFDYIREDRHELYGFSDRAVFHLFQNMLDVPGVGPKLAQKILSSVNQEELREHIAGGNVDLLTGVPGVGKKTAQKLILELQGVLVVDDPTSQDTDTLDALMSLGYSRKDSLEALKHVSADAFEERVREALRLLAG